MSFFFAYFYFFDSYIIFIDFLKNLIYLNNKKKREYNIILSLFNFFSKKIDSTLGTLTLLGLVVFNHFRYKAAVITFLKNNLDLSLFLYYIFIKKT